MIITINDCMTFVIRIPNIAQEPNEYFVKKSAMKKKCTCHDP